MSRLQQERGKPAVALRAHEVEARLPRQQVLARVTRGGVRQSVTLASARCSRCGSLAHRRDLERQLGQEREVGPVAGEAHHRVEPSSSIAAQGRPRGDRSGLDRLDARPPLHRQEPGRIRREVVGVGHDARRSGSGSSATSTQGRRLRARVAHVTRGAGDSRSKQAEGVRRRVAVSDEQHVAAGEAREGAPRASPGGARGGTTTARSPRAGTPPAPDVPPGCRRRRRRRARPPPRSRTRPRGPRPAAGRAAPRGADGPASSRRVIRARPTATTRCPVRTRPRERCVSPPAARARAPPSRPR